MTHHLYYQNVANNAGVLDQLVGSIGHEDLKEAMLAYAVVHGGQVRDETALHDEVAAWLRERFAAEVDFDGPDAVAILARLGLWEDRAAWRVRSPETAVAELERAWQERRTAGHHPRAALRRAG